MTCELITNDIIDEMLNDIIDIKLNSYIRNFDEVSEN